MYNDGLVTTFVYIFRVVVKMLASTNITTDMYYFL